MRAPDDPLWRALEAYKIGPPDAALTFAARLARENRWSLAFAGRVIEEYKRFCFLAMTAGREVTPSDAVDQAWHLHLTYSRDYWERFCPEVFGAPLHHGPTAVSDAGEPFGTVVAVENFGAGDVVEIERPNGKRFMVPMRADAVPEWDAERLVVAADFVEI